MEDIGSLLFTQRIISSLAWPVAFVIVALLFKKEISHLLKRVEIFKVPGAEVQIRRRLDEASEEVAAIQADGTEAANLPAARAPVELIPIERDTVAKHPNFAVIEAWRMVEADVERLIRLLEPNVTSHGARSIRRLQDLNVLAPPVFALLDHLRIIRNEAVHDLSPKITEGQALEYISIASVVRAAIGGKIRKLEGDEQ
jgi:hypothetical protein